MLIVSGKDIKISRGDTAQISFNLKNSDGSEYVLSEGESIKFGVKISADSDTELISKTFTNDNESYVVLSLDGADTNNLTFGQYYYDIRIIDAEGKVNTPMLKAVFEVMEVISDVE